MTVAQLLKALATMPPNAVVLMEGDAGYARIGDVGFQDGSLGMPDEVLLIPDMTD